MRKKHTGMILASVAVSLIVLLALSLLGLNYKVRRDRENYYYIAQNESDKIVTTVDCVMARTSTLKAFVQEHNGDGSFFKTVAANIYNAVREETGVSLKNIAIAPDGVVSSVYPYEGNESLVGFNFLDPAREGNAEAREAYESGFTVLTNPFDLIQGGKGFAGRSPVLVKDGDGESLWGLVTVTIDFDNFISVLKLNNLTGMGLNYELSFIDAAGERNTMDASGALAPDAVRRQFSVRNLTWELAISPSAGWISTELVLLAIGLIVIISALVGMLIHMFFRLRESNATLLQLSNTDRLTGCFNRRAFEDELGRLAALAPGKDFVCASVDVNSLKVANDTFGHAAGDELLTAAAACLEKVFGSLGKVYRTGGDEFEVLFFAGGAQLERCKNDLQKAIEEWKGSIVDRLSLAVGYASKKEFPEASIMEMVKTADGRMYEDKRAYYEHLGTNPRNR